MLAGLHASPATRARRLLLASDAPSTASSSIAPFHVAATDSQVVQRDPLHLGIADESTKAATAEPRRRGPRRARHSRNCKSLQRTVSTMRGPSDDPSQRRLSEQLVETLRHLHRRRALYESVLVDARSGATVYAIDVTTTFYALFARGFDRQKRPQHSREAEAFLRSAMAEDVACKEFVGVDPFLAQYEATTHSHAAMSLELQRVAVLDDDDESRSGRNHIQIFAAATARLRISRATLERFFPSLIQDETLVQRLIGKEYMLHYDKVFHFRLTDGRVFQHESRIDLCASLLTMVGDPFLALQLVEASLMTKHGHWKIDERIEEDRHELENEVL